MYKFVVKGIKAKSSKKLTDIIDLIGELYFSNHKWKVTIQGIYEKETIINGSELIKIIRDGIENKKASFSALEGSQKALQFSIDNSWTIHTIQIRWLEFFQEKCDVHDIEELNNDLPEFNDFMQD